MYIYHAHSRPLVYLSGCWLRITPLGTSADVLSEAFDGTFLLEVVHESVGTSVEHKRLVVILEGNQECEGGSDLAVARDLSYLLYHLAVLVH